MVTNCLRRPIVHIITLKYIFYYFVSKLVGSPIKDSWKKGEFTELKDGTKIRNSEPDVDTDGDFKHSEELREKMIKSNTHKM